MNKLKPLKASLAENIRYVAFEAISEHKLSFNEVEKLIKASSLELFGLFGLAKAGIMLIRNKYDNNKGVIRVNRKYVDYVKASLAMINKKDVVFRSIKVSGMINKL